VLTVLFRSQSFPTLSLRPRLQILRWPTTRRNGGRELPGLVAEPSAPAFPPIAAGARGTDNPRITLGAIRLLPRLGPSDGQGFRGRGTRRNCVNKGPPILKPPVSDLLTCGGHSAEMALTQTGSPRERPSKDNEGDVTVTWLRLSEATTWIHHDVQKARERLGRAISKAWRERPGGLPQPALDANVPLRIKVTPSAGMRIEGRAWLDNPVLDWEASEIECLCKPWVPSWQAQSSEPATQSRARIEVWGKDLPRLLEGDNSAKYGPSIGPDEASEADAPG
jgi:hypothetical protein